jgi:hypothetical protein
MLICVNRNGRQTALGLVSMMRGLLQLDLETLIVIEIYTFLTKLNFSVRPAPVQMRW